MVSRDVVADGFEESDLMSELRSKSVLASQATLLGIGLSSVVGIALTALLSGGRYYLLLPFVAAACFAVYGLSAQRMMAAGSADADSPPEPEPTVVMKGAELIGVVAAVEALLAFFFLVLGPRWIS